MEYLHQNEIILRDVSPANMWITPDERLKLVEFGAARDSLSFLDAPGDGQSDLTIEGTRSGPTNTCRRSKPPIRDRRMPAAISIRSVAPFITR